MTSTADQRGWGNPRSPSFEADIRAKCVLVAAGGISVRLHQDVADVFRYLNTGLARRYNLAGYADDYGLAIRPIRGYEQQWAATHDPRYLSNHSYGLAEDLDSSINPMTSDLQAHHEFIRTVIDPLLAPFGGRLVWGGEYSSARKDYMHFEYIGTPAQARADSAHARQLLPPVHAHTVTPPAPLLEEDVMHVIHSPSHSIALISPNGKGGICLEKLSADEAAALTAGGVRRTEITDAQFLAHVALAKRTA